MAAEPQAEASDRGRSRSPRADPGATSTEADETWTNKGPSLKGHAQVLLENISVQRPISGWRDPDPGRCDELREVFMNGGWGMKCAQWHPTSGGRGLRWEANRG